MAIDSDITPGTLVIQALKQAGRVNPSNDQIADATNYQYRRVKSDIADKSGRHDALLTQAVTTVFTGLQRYAWPTDAHYIKSVTILAGPTDWEGVAQAGASGQITLALAFNFSQEDIQGKYIVLTGGTGANQIRQITGYNNGTKVATVDSNWTTNPAGGTSYKIMSDHRLAWREDKVWDWQTNPTPGSRGPSYSGTMSGREFWLHNTPDQIYALWWDYWAHMDYLDNTSAVLLRHIRSHYSLWSQGVTAWLCQRYDEDRYQAELGVYENLLAAYEASASHVTQTQFHDV